MSDPEQRQAMTSLLDRVNEDAKSLVRKAGYEDRHTLDEYLTAVRETEVRVQNMNQASNAPRIDFSQLKRPRAEPISTSRLKPDLPGPMDRLTRCITYMLGNSNNRMVFDFLGIAEQHHYPPISSANSTWSPPENKPLAMEKFDYLLTKLKSYRTTMARS